ncbi:MAG: sensor histidine kinase [Acidobacteria bacterium]|nr:MAG: sensor histidine kinase [Acidobacteriota bacterium]
MLYEFVTTYREAIIAKTRTKVSSRPWPPASTAELQNGLPIFLSQLAETLQWENTETPFSDRAIGDSATRHGGDLFALGFTVSQVVHDYGDICQAITELALEQQAPITAGEFHTLNSCLDTAIADAVTEHARITSASRSTEELERMGQVTHEIRNMLNTALLAFDVVKRGTVGVNGNTGAVLGRSLTDVRDLVDSTLSDIRTGASHQRPELVSVSALLNDIAVGAHLQAEYGGLQFILEPIDPGLSVHVDQQLLASAVTNLLSNAFKYTRAGGRVILRARGREEGRVAIEVKDACGGIPESKGDLFEPFGERRAKNRTGLGLGLSIARKAIRAQGGDIEVRNMPGKGCTFVINVPAAQEVPSIAVGDPVQ